jgi:hypothetical protein
MTPLYLDRMLSNDIFTLRKKTISSICLNEIPDIPPFFTGTLIVMGVLIFFKKKTGLSTNKGTTSYWLRFRKIQIQFTAFILNVVFV